MSTRREMLQNQSYQKLVRLYCAFEGGDIIPLELNAESQRQVRCWVTQGNVIRYRLYDCFGSRLPPNGKKTLNKMTAYTDPITLIANIGSSLLRFLANQWVNQQDYERDSA